MAARTYPANFTWDAEAKVMRPDALGLRLCLRQYVHGGVYPLAPIEARSRESHNHYFATLGDIFDNLPEDQAIRFPTSEHMRKWALVEAGYCTETNYVCDSKGHALNLTAIIRRLNEFCVIRVGGPVVRIYEPKSQSAAAMGREAFEDSKKKVLAICAALTSTSVEEFERNAAERVPRDRPFGGTP